jgi:hypothetical protein
MSLQRAGIVRAGKFRGLSDYLTLMRAEAPHSARVGLRTHSFCVWGRRIRAASTSIPTGLRHSAQSCAAEALLWVTAGQIFQP